MGASTGISAIGTYDAATNKGVIDQLLALIPNISTTSSSGAVAGGTNGVANTYLDEMSPAAAVQLRVELEAVKAAIENV
jgi:hypothetical protein